MFLDIRMPGVDGMTLAQQHLDLPPIIFCTAFDEFAVKAFEVNAVDYLLKPVRPERLVAAIEKVRRKQAASSERVAKALQAVAPVQGTRIVSSTRGEVRFFDAKALTRLWASDKYTVFLADGEEQLTEESLSTLEQRLAPHGFLRVHRAELIRLDAVKALTTEGPVGPVGPVAPSVPSDPAAPVAPVGPMAPGGLGRGWCVRERTEE
jgi:DNA-binding LytR/AlgR family response regulator